MRDDCFIFFAKTDKHPEFPNKIRDSRKKMFHTVIVWEIEGFGCNRYDSASQQDPLKTNVIKVVSTTNLQNEKAKGNEFEPRSPIWNFKFSLPDKHILASSIPEYCIATWSAAGESCRKSYNHQRSCRKNENLLTFLAFRI